MPMILSFKEIEAITVSPCLKHKKSLGFHKNQVIIEWSIGDSNP